MSSLDLTQLDDVRDNLIRELELTNDDHGKPGGSTCVDGVVSGVLMALEHHYSAPGGGIIQQGADHSVKQERQRAWYLDDMAYHCRDELDCEILRCAADLHRLRVAWRTGAASGKSFLSQAMHRLWWIAEHVQAVNEAALLAALESRMDVPDDHPRSPYPTYSILTAGTLRDLCWRVEKYVRMCAALVGENPATCVIAGPTEDSDSERRGYFISWPSGPNDWACTGENLGMRLPSGFWIEAGSGGTLSIHED